MPEHYPSWLFFASWLMNVRGNCQKEAAAIAGGGVNAFSRYEHGKSKPVAAVVNLFRILGKRPELVEEIR
jgi:hypothetical protein